MPDTTEPRSVLGVSVRSLVQYHAMGALRFASGQAVERRGLGDSLAMMHQLGLILEGPSRIDPAIPLTSGGELAPIAASKGVAVQLADLTSGGFIGVWAVLYFVLLVTLGIMSIRKGHWVMFVVGLFLPLFWFIGALLPRRR